MMMIVRSYASKIGTMLDLRTTRDPEAEMSEIRLSLQRLAGT
jgi:hypothetical protein